MNSHASEAFYSAWRAERHGHAEVAGETHYGLDRSPVDAAKAAAVLDPHWVAPARFLDESLHRLALTLPERYGQYVTVAADPDRPAAQRARASYLAGRLGGKSGTRRLARSADLDPSLGWAWHGIAWRAFSAGQARRAIWAGERAVAYARDAHELTHFASALARYQGEEQLPTGAQRTLAAALTAEAPLALRPDEEARIQVELARLELDSPGTADVRRGVRRSLQSLQDPGLTLAERLNLILALRTGPVRSGAVSEDEIAHAVLVGAQQLMSSAGQDIVGGRAVERLVDAMLSDIGGRAEPGARRSPPADAMERMVAAFRAPLGSGAALAEYERWLSSLPSSVKRSDGSFVRQELGALHAALLGVATGSVKIADSTFGGDRREGLHTEGTHTEAAQTDQWDSAVATALMAAGWFREARALAEGVLERKGWERSAEAREPTSIRASARALQRDAIQARAVLSGIGALAQRIDAREAFIRAGALGSAPLESVEGGRVETLRELQGEIGELFRRQQLAGPEEHLRPSPVIKYGPVGRVVHPGPAFSAEDEALGRGTVGDPVPGISALFHQMGRFALLGNGVGQGGPDATILRIVGVQQRAGKHLGRPFRGTVFWCDGADVPGRYGRQGAGISGAALHEGYYVDLSMIRLEEQQWERLRARFDGDADGVRTALQAPGARVPKRFMTEVTPALGAADRMRLTVMSTPAVGSGLDSSPASAKRLRPMTVAALSDVVATHEEGHLCDRASWYPLSFGRLFKLIGFAGAHGFKGGRIGQALEERAQLVALCDCSDPRLAWVDLLDAAESDNGGGVTPHAAAYRRLLGDLLERLDAEVKSGDWLGVQLDASVRWIDQLHLIPGDQLRDLARREAGARF